MATVLLIDGNPVSQRVLSFILKRGTYDVATARTGAEAATLMKNIACDLVVTSVPCALADAIPTLGIVRSTQRGRSVPLMVLTECGCEQERAATLDAGADAFLLHPLSSRELLNEITALVEHRRGVVPLLTPRVVNDLPLRAHAVAGYLDEAA